MRRILFIFSCPVLIIASFGFAQQQPQPAPPRKSAIATTPQEPVLPYSPSLDLTSMDKSIDPCVDFYQYACGGWQKKNPIPPDQTSWAVYGKLYVDNLNFLRGILQQAASQKSSADPVTREIGDFYGACMDEATIEKRRLNAIKPDLDVIPGLKSVHDLAPVVAQLELKIPNTSVIFDTRSIQDPDDSEQQIGNFDQGGLGLP